MSDFKMMLKDDLDEVFFDEDFTSILKIENLDVKIPCFFDTKSNIESEFTEVVIAEPSVLVKTEDAEAIEADEIVYVEDKKFKVNYKEDENPDMVRVYLEKRRQ
jgi:hypothetical protein